MTNVLKSLPEKLSSEFDVMGDIRYIRKSCSLVTDALKKGCDVLQMPNGNIVITETRTVSFEYRWNSMKTKFEKVKSGSRLRRLRSQKAAYEQQVGGGEQFQPHAAEFAKGSKVTSSARKQKVLEEEMAD